MYSEEEKKNITNTQVQNYAHVLMFNWMMTIYFTKIFNLIECRR